MTDHGRLAGNWLQAYQEYTKESESPTSYHLFCGLSALASAVRRNVWLDQGLFVVYPNLYVVLVGPSGKVRKSTSIRLARKLLYAVDEVNMGPDSVTREELIQQMAQDPEMTLHSTELSSLIEPSGIKMIQFLTDIFDCEWNPKGWRYATKGSGRDTVERPVLNLLGATTPSWISDGLPENVVSHGFTSRTLFVYEEETRFANAFPDSPPDKLVTALKRDLKHISLIEGEFSWGDGTKDVYEEYYESIRDETPDDHRLEGFHWRKDVHALKLAMLLSLAESDKLVLKPQDLHAAKELLNVIKDNMPKTFSAVGKYEHASDLERIWAQIATGEEGMPVAQIYESNFFSGTPEEIRDIITHLKMMEKAKIEKRNGQRYLVPTVPLREGPGMVEAGDRPTPDLPGSEPE